MLVMTQDTLKRLYDFNQRSENWDLKGYTPGTRNRAGDQWGGGHTRRLLGLAFTLAFSCLLRADEVLKIKSQDIVLIGEHRLELTVPFRKTSQYGSESNYSGCSHTSSTDHLSYCKEIEPFVLHELPDLMAHLCPVRAYSEWLNVSQIESGFVFRKLGSGDQVSENDQPMVRTL